MKIKKILSSMLLFLIGLLSFNLCLSAQENQNGDIRNNNITLGSAENEGGVEVTKEISKINDEGLFKVKFNLTGKDATITNQKKIYVVVVFDRSGSMLCESGTYEPWFGNGYVYNNHTLKCYDNEETPNANKWESAVRGAIRFSNNLLNSVSSSKISLLTFGSMASNGTNFDNTSFSTNQFSYPNGGTNLGSAIEKAASKLNSITESNAAKYIVIISDGKPDNVNDAIDESAEAKNKGIKIYSIGYETDEEAKNTLKTISSNNTCYNASSSELVNVLLDISNEISKINSGSNAILTDTIGDDFTFVSSDYSSLQVNGKEISYDFGIVTETEKSFDYLIQLTLPQITAWHDTNKEASLNYVDYNNSNQELTWTSSPQIYWLTKYNYTVNYYKDEISEKNFLGSDVLSELLDAEIEIVDKTLYIPTGYIFKSVTTLPLVITSNEDENTINVIYEKNNKISYTVEYYYDGVLDNSKTSIISNQTYGSIITDYQDKSGSNYKFKSDNAPYTLDLENNIIKVYYEKIVVEENEIIPPKTGIEGNNISLLYIAPLLVLFIKKVLF